MENEASLSKVDMISIVKKAGKDLGFKAHLAFSPFEWYLAEKIVANEAEIEVLDP